MGKKIVMGDAHEVPYEVDVDSLDYEVVGRWNCDLCPSLHKDEIVYCWRMNEKYHAVVYVGGHTDRLYDCGEYKYYSGFARWLERFYPLAYQVSHYEPSRQGRKM